MKKHLKKLWFLPIVAVLVYFIVQKISIDAKTENRDDNQVLHNLLEGNERFVHGRAIHPDQSLEHLRKLTKGQKPLAAIISCADSRVPPELIFDQGFGDLFVIRNAGNIVSDYEIGSVEYALKVLNVPLVIVMGHTNCGALHAFAQQVRQGQKEVLPEHIQKIVDYIKAEEEENELPKNIPDFLDRAIEANVLHGVHELKRNIPEINSLVAEGKLTIVGAIYDMETGKVRLLNDNQ